jgi:hypothetical protein
MATIKGIDVTPAQLEVYTALKEAGVKGWPDHILVPVVQHTGQLHQHSSGIRTRRRELCDMFLVQYTGSDARTNSGRRAARFKAVR